MKQDSCAEPCKVIDNSICPNNSRQRYLRARDNRGANTGERKSNEDLNEINDSPSSLLKEIRKAAKCMEITGQILKNQFGTYEKSKLRDLFEVAQGVGLRLIKSFVMLMQNESRALEGIVKNALDKEFKTHIKEYDKNQIDNLINKIITELSYGVIFGWLNKIVDCLGYHKTISIADEVNENINTVASNLINISIHLWDGKNLDIKKLRKLYKNFDQEKNFIAISYLRYVVVRHIYMHKVDFNDKQSIKSLFGFSISNQIVAQRNISK